MFPCNLVRISLSTLFSLEKIDFGSLRKLKTIYIENCPLLSDITPSTLPTSLDCLRIDFCDSRSEEHTSELQSLMRISYAVFCLKKKRPPHQKTLVETKP